MVLEPVVLKTTLQVPFALDGPLGESVNVQLVSAPVMATVPVGVAPVLLTVTPTTTDWPGVDGVATVPVMVTVGTSLAGTTVSLALPELPL
jgi:hypothetical protein